MNNKKEKKIEWYREFNDFNYKPSDTDLVALFYFEPTEGMAAEDCIGRIASESSIGTWTTLETLDDRIFGLRANSFWMNEEKNLVKVSYPLELWELNNVPQLMSGVAGNIFGMKAVKNLRLVDLTLPESYIKGNKGPHMGVESIKKIFNRDEGPITACVPKPKIGMTTEQHVKTAVDAWTGGVDCIKDDENLTSQSFNRFELRVEKMAQARDKVEKETGLVKEAYINVTAETKVMEKRIKMLHEHGFRYAMVDVVTAGFSAVQTLRDTIEEYDMALHAHRAMHASFTKHNTHGISMLMLAKLYRLIGVDNLHIGTVVGKLDSPKEDVLAMKELLLNKEVGETPIQGGFRLSQKWGNIKGTLPCASGGLHPGVIPEVMNVYGTTDMILQVGGGIHGHPDGTKAGAKAMVQAIEATKDGLTLEDKAKSSPELAKALEKWGYLKPV